MNFLAWLAAVKLLPYKLRQAAHTAWMKVIMSPIQWLNDLIFEDYYQGTSASFYSSGHFYSKGERAVGADNAVYESITEPVAIKPAPPNVLYWEKILDDYIGANERLRYNGQKLNLEYALNKWFRTVFRQPTSTSDIYIDRNQYLNFHYTGGANQYPSNYIYGSNLQGEGFIIDDNGASESSFTIFVPESVTSPIPGFFTSLQPYAEQKIRAVADKYVIAGVLYTVTTY